jgi:hypothetical protein
MWRREPIARVVVVVRVEIRLTTCESVLPIESPMDEGEASATRNDRLPETEVRIRETDARLTEMLSVRAIALESVVTEVRLMSRVRPDRIASVRRVEEPSERS